MKRKAASIYPSTKRHGVTCPLGVTSQKTVSIKSNYIQLGTEPCNQLMERATEPCHPAVVLFTENPILSHFVTFRFIICDSPQLPVYLDDSWRIPPTPLKRCSQQLWLSHPWLDPQIVHIHPPLARKGPCSCIKC